VTLVIVSSWAVLIAGVYLTVLFRLGIAVTAAATTALRSPCL